MAYLQRLIPRTCLFEGNEVLHSESVLPCCPCVTSGTRISPRELYKRLRCDGAFINVLL